MYGIKHKLDQFNPSPLTRVRGLYLSGQAVAAPGLLGATISAFMTVGEVVGHQPLKKFRREKICDA
jgi:all-trans-retinol 13,14-reductase